MTIQTGMKIDMQSVGLISDNFICTQAHELTLPAWATEQVLDKASQLDDYVFLNVVGTKEQQRLITNFLFKISAFFGKNCDIVLQNL